MGRNNESRLDRRIAKAKEKTKAAEAAEQSSDKPGRTSERISEPASERMPFRSWLSVLRRAAGASKGDELLDRAAALTYYGFLAVFPTLLLAVSVLGLLGDSEVKKVLDNVQKLAPGSVRNVLSTAITQVRASRGTGGTLAVAGFAGALWSASGYVGAFIRASNVVYGVRRQRPIWKTTPLRIGLTLLMLVTSIVSAVIVVFTGPLAAKTASILGLGHTAVTVWSIAKWPVLVLLMSAMIVLLFWASPRLHGPGFRWISPGATLAVVLWLVLSTGFAAYVANFASYNKTYGAVAGVVVFLLWLWLSNLAILLGLEFDAELARGNHAGAAAAGVPAARES